MLQTTHGQKWCKFLFCFGCDKGWVEREGRRRDSSTPTPHTHTYIGWTETIIIFQAYHALLQSFPAGTAITAPQSPRSTHYSPHSLHTHARFIIDGMECIMCVLINSAERNGINAIFFLFLFVHPCFVCMVRRADRWMDRYLLLLLLSLLHFKLRIWKVWGNCQSI